MEKKSVNDYVREYRQLYCLDNKGQNIKLSTDEIKKSITNFLKKNVHHEDLLLNGEEFIQELSYTIAQFGNSKDKDLYPYEINNFFFDSKGNYTKDYQKILNKRCTSADYSLYCNSRMEKIENKPGKSKESINKELKELKKMETLRKRNNKFVMFFKRLFGNRDNEVMEEMKNRFHNCHNNYSIDDINNLISLDDKESEKIIESKLTIENSKVDTVSFEIKNEEINEEVTDTKTKDNKKEFIKESKEEVKETEEFTLEIK